MERFGARRGSWLTLKRLFRCHPLSTQFGFDPVPEQWDSLLPELHKAECNMRPDTLAEASAQVNEVRS
jgi:putative component of membrane protein insertase Oxa1/YidC/SpoIIIJ protein YidD